MSWTIDGKIVNYHSPIQLLTIQIMVNSCKANQWDFSTFALKTNIMKLQLPYLELFSYEKDFIQIFGVTSLSFCKFITNLFLVYYTNNK